MTDVAAPSLSQRAAMGAGWIIAWRLATRNIGLLSTLVLVRLLAPTDFGLVALATGFINSVDALSAIGVQEALVRAPDVDRDMYDAGFALSVLRGLLTALLVAAISLPAGGFFDDPRLTIVMLALAAGTLVSAFENIGIVDFRRTLAFRKEFEMQVWSRVLGTLCTIAVAAVWHTYWALVAGILAYRLARLGQSYMISAYRPRFTLHAWRRILGFSLWTWGQTLLYQVRDRSDSIVIGHVLGTAPVGLFSVGLELGLLPVTELVEPLGRALFSGFASLQQSSKDLAAMFRGAVGLGFMLVLPAGIGISMVADPMVRLCLGEHWAAAVPVVQIVAICGTTGIFTQCCANLLNAVGRPHVTFYTGMTSTAVKLVALVILVPVLGVRGAAAALVVASAADLALLLWVTLPGVRISVCQLAGVAARPSVAAGAMVLALWYMGMAWTVCEGNTVAEVALDAVRRCALGAVCYGLALAGLWLISGRPDGAERFALRLTATLWKRTRR
jgi:lipopolysaccharide exporter